MKILLVDDHTHVREGLRQMLELQEGMDVIGECNNGREAVDAVDREVPDIVLMDMRMPEMDGIEATKLIKERHPDVKVLALTAFGEMSLIASMVSAGSSGYVLKGGSPKQLVDTIHAINQGRRALDKEIGRTLHEEDRPSPREAISKDPARGSTSFLSVGAEEMSGPLAEMKASLTSLQRGWDRLDEDARLFLIDSLAVSLDRLETMLGRSLTVSGIQVGPSRPRGIEPLQATFSLADAAREAVAQFDEHVRQRISLNLKEVEAIGHQDHMREAAYALVENALYYTDGRVVVRVTSDDSDMARLEVQDEGPGLPHNNILDLTLETGEGIRREGQGLSLKIVGTLLDAAGGRLDVDTGPDRGSTFTMVLPAAWHHSEL